MRTREEWEFRMASMLDAWVARDGVNRQWVKLSPLSIYIRKGPKGIMGARYDHVFTLASAEVRQQSQGKGYLGFVLSWMDRLIADPSSPFQAIYLENALVPRIRDIANRHGWIHDRSPHLLEHGIPSFYKLRGGAGVSPPA